jgi:hypothetical protein
LAPEVSGLEKTNLLQFHMLKTKFEVSSMLSGP